MTEPWRHIVKPCRPRFRTSRSLSSRNHLQEQANAFADIYHRNQQLFESQRAQFLAGTTSEQSLLTQPLTLLSPRRA